MELSLRYNTAIEFYCMLQPAHYRLISLQIFGDFSSVSGISPVIKNSDNIHHSLSSFGHSESSLQRRAGDSSLSRITSPPVPGLSTPTQKPLAADTVLLPEDQQDSTSVHSTLDEAISGAKSFHQKEMDHSNSSLKVPEQDISSPYHRHTRGAEYQSTSLVAEAKALEVSLSIPDHSEGMCSEDSSSDPSNFKKQHDYFSPSDKDMDRSLTIEDKDVDDFHSDEEQHLLDDADGSEYKLKTGELKNTKIRFEKLRFEKKLSAGQLV